MPPVPVTAAVRTSHPPRSAAAAARAPLLRWILVAGAIVFSALTWLDFRAFAKRREELLAVASSDEVTQVVALLEETVERETDLDRTASGIARLLVFSEIGLGDSDTAIASEALADQRLELVGRLAAEALRERPTMEGAAAALGAANYLRLRRAQDQRLVSQAALWERPLELARALRQRGDGSRILAVTYLELWPFLSNEKRGLARELLAEAFRDQRLFARVIEAWLEIAGSRDDAYEVVPDRVVSWTFLERFYASRRDWEAFLDVVERRDRAVRREAEQTLERAELLLRRRLINRARREYLGLLADLEPARENVPYIERMLAEAPASPPQGPRLQQHIHRWLDWTLTLCRGAGCPLTASALARLRGLADDVPEPTLALSALFSERPIGEEVIRPNEDLTSAAWADYHVFRARRLAQRGRGAEASAVLASVVGETGPWYWLARRDVARASGDANALDLAERELERLGRGPWSSADWEPSSRSDSARRIDLYLPRNAQAISLTVEAPSSGAAVEIRVDGARRSLVVVSGTAQLDLDVPLEAGIHSIEIYSRAGGSISPSSLSLGY